MTQATQIAPRTALFRPFHRSKSDRMLESTKDMPQPTFLDMPDVLVIDNYSFVTENLEDGTRKRRATRWYAGLGTTCGSIFLDDQQKWDRENGVTGRKIQPQDIIYLTGGVLSLVDNERDHLLFEFLAKHNDNVTNPHRTKPIDGEDVCAFEQIDFQKEAATAIDQMDLLQDAWDLLGKCRTRTGAVKEFNTDELGKLKSIFAIQLPSAEESYKALSDIATQNPAYFIGTIGRQRTMIVEDFNAAVDSGAMNYKEGKYYINGSVVFTAAQGTKAATHDAQIIDFLSKESGYGVYTEMRNQTTVNQLQPK